MSDTPAKSSGSAGTASLLLRVRRPDGKQLEFYLADGLTIGRTVANTIVLIDEDAADRTHARVEFLPDGSARLRCLDPSSRVLVGGTQRAELALTAGVRFQIGRSDFECLPGQRELPPARTVDTTACPFCGTKRLPAQRNVETACTSCQQGILVLQLGPEYPQPVVVPSQYGVYRAERFVARGGMGLVLKGIDGDTSAAVAIKLLHPQRNIDRTSATRFKQEIAMLKRVSHPNVVGLSGYGNVACGLRADGQPNRMSFLVTPWIDGHSLRDVLVDAGRKKQMVAFDQALDWFRQVCKGLAAIHAVGIVHRDLKPSNILIGQNGRALIVDLGIAKGPEGPIAITTTGEAPGTCEYMAPEQLLAPNTVDGRSDLYSLGVTFYEVLTGERPIGAWLPASHTNRSVPDWFDKVLRRLLARAPSDRYADIYDLLAQLNTNAISEPMPSLALEIPTKGSSAIEVDKGVQERSPPLASEVLRHKARMAKERDAVATSPSASSDSYVSWDKKWWVKSIGAAIAALLVAMARVHNRPAKPAAMPAIDPSHHSNELLKEDLESQRYATAKNFTNSLDMKLVLVPAGEFQMGSPENELEHSTDEKQHRVRITKPFYLGVYAVTQGEYKDLMGTNPSYFSSEGAGKDKVAGLDTRRLPVENISWNDAVEFCRKLSQKEARTYRLPTEAEWEYACRAGTTTPFHFGSTLNGDLANCKGSHPYGTTSKGKYLERTTTVGSYPPNAIGLYDMHGNVWQWCSDWYWEDYYAVSPPGDPLGPNFGSLRVSRGGGWLYGAPFCRAAFRFEHLPGSRCDNMGFRVALVPSGK